MGIYQTRLNTPFQPQALPNNREMCIYLILFNIPLPAKGIKEQILHFVSTLSVGLPSDRSRIYAKHLPQMFGKGSPPQVHELANSLDLYWRCEY